MPCTPYLAGSAVGQARPVVRGQVEVGGAGTRVQLVRGQQAQVAAATIVQRAHVSGHCGQNREVDQSLLSQHTLGYLLYG